MGFHPVGPSIGPAGVPGPGGARSPTDRHLGADPGTNVVVTSSASAWAAPTTLHLTRRSSWARAPSTASTWSGVGRRRVVPHRDQRLSTPASCTWPSTCSVLWCSAPCLSLDGQGAVPGDLAMSPSPARWACSSRSQRGDGWVRQVPFGLGAAIIGQKASRHQPRHSRHRRPARHQPGLTFIVPGISIRAVGVGSGHGRRAILILGHRRPPLEATAVAICVALTVGNGAGLRRRGQRPRRHN